MNMIQVFCSFVKGRFMSNMQKDLEILALRSQLAILQEHIMQTSREFLHSRLVVNQSTALLTG